MQRDQIIESLSFWNLWEKDIETGIGREEYLVLCTRYLSTDEIISVRETFLRELSGLQEAMEYFKLKESLLITAEAQPREITEKGLKIKIRPFHQWALK